MPGDDAVQHSLTDATRDDASLRRFLHGLPGVDQVGAEARAASLATRSIKTTAKAWAIDTAISMVDLTTLEGADTPGKVRSLCAKAVRPDDGAAGQSPPSASTPTSSRPRSTPCAASTVQVASVATAFPSGRAALETKLHDVRDAVAAGATEIDMVIDRGAFLAGRYLQVFDEIVATKQACGTAHLKVILETGELVTLDNARRASWLALLAGGDFIKTSTGKVTPAATPPVALVMLAGRARLRRPDRRAARREARRRHPDDEGGRALPGDGQRGRRRGLADPDLFRFGASSLLNDLLQQRHKLATGAYDGPDYVTVD